MLLDAGYCPGQGHDATPSDENPFHTLYLRTFGDATACFSGIADGDDGELPLDALDTLDALETPMDAPLDANVNSLFVDAFQYWRQDDAEGDCGTEYSSSSLYSSSPGDGDLPVIKLECPEDNNQPQSILLHTGANVVDMVSGVTCSGLGLGALGVNGGLAARPHKDVIGDLTRASSTGLGPSIAGPRGSSNQGSFGHLLRQQRVQLQRPASLSGDVRELRHLQLSSNQVVTRQRPHSEDLHVRRDDAEDLDDDDEDDDVDDDVFLESEDLVTSSTPLARRQRNSSSSISNEDVSDEEDQREDPACVAECRWSECGLQFAGRAPLVRHIEKVHVEPRRGEDFSCLWLCCPRGARPFNARYKLLIHMRVHSGEKPNKCPFPSCPKAFSRLENLKIHQRSHTGERPYCCQFSGCSKAFSNSSDRAKHQRTHFDTKPYACQVPGCSKRYTDPSSLRKHVKNHSGRDHGHAQARRAGSGSGSTGDSEGSPSSEPLTPLQQHYACQTEHTGKYDEYADDPHAVDGVVSAGGDLSLDDAMFPSADDIDQAIREFIPFDEVGKLLAEPGGVTGFDLHEPLELDFDHTFWNSSA